MSDPVHHTAPVEAPIRTCRACGCTDATACPGGCAWAEADLCTACAAALAADVVALAAAVDADLAAVADEAGPPAEVEVLRMDTGTGLVVEAIGAEIVDLDDDTVAVGLGLTGHPGNDPDRRAEALLLLSHDAAIGLIVETVKGVGQLGPNTGEAFLTEVLLALHRETGAAAPPTLVEAPRTLVVPSGRYTPPKARPEPRHRR
jgi:hypothetical protein